MDYVAYVMKTYQNELRVLADSLQSPVPQQKKKGEPEIDKQTKQLFRRIREDFPSRLSRNFVLTFLHQEIGATSDAAANVLRATWQQDILTAKNQDIGEQEIKLWSLSDVTLMCSEPEPDLDRLPLGSWFLHLVFRLATPYISGGGDPVYLIDNPLTKDRVLGLPLIHASSWKGNLRSSLRLAKRFGDEQVEMIRLFGSSNGTEENSRAGRLEFYPTFFYRISLEVINPHERARKVGKNPILFECIPIGAKGTFSLLYVPFDLIGSKCEEDIKHEAKIDLQHVAEAISAMMLTYGFSAKRTSGFGAAEDTISGVVQTRAGSCEPKSLGALPKEVNRVQF